MTFQTKYFLIFIIILFLVKSSHSKLLKECLRQFGEVTYNFHPDMYLTTPQVISKYGYPVETHTVVTDDSYILTLFRIPAKISSKNHHKLNKYPVYLNHGLFSNGHIWLMQHGTRNLAFKLASEGYDVWLANARGTAYSQEHVRFRPDEQRFWKFSFHEMGIYDLPATIHYMRSVTRQKKVYYIGYSMGSTEFFVAMSEIPELNNFVATAILYAPVAFLSHTESIGKHFAPMAEELYVLTHQELRGQFNGMVYFEKQFGSKLGELCSRVDLACGLCDKLNTQAFGKDPLQMNYTLQSLFFSHVPDSVSTRTIVHFLQLIRSGKFCQFDYGSDSENEKRYGEGVTQPPAYNLSRITVPTVLVWSENDNLATPKDVNLTISHLPPDTVKETFRVDWDLWTHRDFIQGIDADRYVYDHTLNILNNKLYDV